MTALIDISIVFCDVGQCYQQNLQVAEHSTIAQAIAQSDLAAQVVLPEPLVVGIFGLKMNMDTVLNAGDRIEIYRPLTMNPKDIRRKRAEKHPVGRFQRGNQFRKQQIRENQAKQRKG